MESLFSIILNFKNVGAWDEKHPRSVHFDVETADGVKRMYLALRSDGVLTLKEGVDDGR